MSTNYTVLLFYITVEAATGVFWKKMLFKNSCFEICQVKFLVNTFRDVRFQDSCSLITSFSGCLRIIKEKRFSSFDFFTTELFTQAHTYIPFYFV